MQTQTQRQKSKSKHSWARHVCLGLCLKKTIKLFTSTKGKLIMNCSVAFIVFLSNLDIYCINHGQSFSHFQSYKFEMPILFAHHCLLAEQLLSPQILFLFEQNKHCLAIISIKIFHNTINAAPKVL